MPKIENKRVAQGDRFLIETSIVAQTIKKSRIGIKGVGEVKRYFFALIIHSATGQFRSSAQRSRVNEGGCSFSHFLSVLYR